MCMIWKTQHTEMGLDVDISASQLKPRPLLPHPVPPSPKKIFINPPQTGPCSFLFIGAFKEALAELLPQLQRIQSRLD